MRDGSEEETLAYVHTVVDFFNAGWQKVLAFDLQHKGHNFCWIDY